MQDKKNLHRLQFTDEEKGGTVKAFLWGVDSMYPVDVKTITQ